MQFMLDYFLRRYLAFCIDLFIVSVPFVAYKMIMSGDNRFDVLAMMIVYILFLCRDIRGKSLGKQITKLEIVSQKNPDKKVSKGKLILRNLLMPLWVIEGLSMLFLAGNQKFSDKILGLSVRIQIS